MSHIVKCKIIVRDLDALQRACESLGLELKLGQKWYKAYDPGECDHAIAVKGATSLTYEVGLKQTADGFALLLDELNGGHGLVDAVGYNCSKLLGLYAVEAARAEAERQCLMVEDSEDGGIRIQTAPGHWVSVNASGIVEAEGFQGVGCKAATQAFEQAVGRGVGYASKNTMWQQDAHVSVPTK